MAAEISDNVDYSPWLTTGADVSDDPGFQGNFSKLTVNAASPRHAGQTTGNLQEGIDQVLAGGTVYVGTGTYVEQLEINKTLAVIEAEGHDAVIKSPASLALGFTTRCE